MINIVIIILVIIIIVIIICNRQCVGLWQSYDIPPSGVMNSMGVLAGAA